MWWSSGPSDGEIILDYYSEPDVVTMVLMKRKKEDQTQKLEMWWWNQVFEWCEEGATRQEM